MIFSRFECAEIHKIRGPPHRCGRLEISIVVVQLDVHTRLSPPPRCSEHHALQSWRGWAPHRGIVPSPFKIPVSGESMRSDATSLWDGIPGARTAATEFRPSTGEGGGGDP